LPRTGFVSVYAIWAFIMATMKSNCLGKVFFMGKFTTLLIGGAVGAIAGLLLSPRSGSENRALIEETVKEKRGKIACPAKVQEKAGQIAQAAASGSTKVINTVVDNGAEARKAVSERASKLTPPSVQAFENNGDELRQKIEAARERIAAQVAKNAEAARDAAVDKIPAVIDAAGAAKGSAAAAAATATEAVKGAASAVASKVKPADEAAEQATQEIPVVEAAPAAEAPAAEATFSPAHAAPEQPAEGASQE
jgi:gas vesicle protein